MSSTFAISSTKATAPALDALLTGAALVSLAATGWLRITGDDRVRWLNGMVTNSIQALTPGQGCYNFFLNAQGKIQADGTAFALADALLLETAHPDTLAALLDRFIIMDDVELAILPPEARAGLLIAGPQAAAALATLGLAPSGAPSPHLTQASWNGAAVDLIHAHGPLVPRFELWSDPATLTALAAALTAAGVTSFTPEVLELLHVLEGTPLYGTDIREKELPQETAQARALHFAKGCYLGQEIVERIRSRGNVHRTFAGFTLTGDLPAIGTPLTAADAPDKPIGELTSVLHVQLPSGPVQLALGYIRREVLERAAVLAYPGGTAISAKLPFEIARTSVTPTHPEVSEPSTPTLETESIHVR